MAVLYLADHGDTHILASKELAHRLGIPAELLGKVLQALARAGIVEAVQGARGGYQLVRSIDTLTLGDFIEAIEGPILLTKCQVDTERCEQSSTCLIRSPMKSVHSRLHDFFQSIPIRDLIESPAGSPKGVRP